MLKNYACTRFYTLTLHLFDSTLKSTLESCKRLISLQVHDLGNEKSRETVKMHCQSHEETAHLFNARNIRSQRR